MAQTVQADFDKALQAIQKLPPSDQLRLVERVVSDLKEAEPINEDASTLQNEDDDLLSDEEVEALLKGNPKTGAEIIASDLIGAWADLGITDSEEWLAEVRRKRQAKLKW